MDILGATASIAQLAVYTHSAWRILTRLYIELKEGPAAWKEHRKNLEHLFQIIKRISTLSEQTQLNTSRQIATLVFELREIAEEALKTIERANAKIFGIRWFAIGVTELLDRSFESLKSKRDILSLILQSETLTELTSAGNRRRYCQRHLEITRMDQGTPSHDIASLEKDQPHGITLEMTSKQVGNGTTMISNNGLGHIIDQIKGSIRLSTSSDGDGVAVNTNNIYMDPDVIKKQLEIAEAYAREHTAEHRTKTRMSRARAKSAETKQRLKLNAPP
ncbi:hypothetical protein PMIN05_005200 [Paraphaeosphaeria minitans]